MKQALGETGKSPGFPPNLRKLFQKLKFWNRLNFFMNATEIISQNAELKYKGEQPQSRSPFSYLFPLIKSGSDLG
jgi:hypothetical protein